MPRYSPRGGYLSYIRDQNLYVYDIAHAAAERPITSDGGGAIKNGMAEFVAQEEMGRSTGYWWAPDDRHIAFARVDESPVKLTQRFEIAADNVSTTFDSAIRPRAGQRARAARRRGSWQRRESRWIDLGADPDIYLARVNWLPDGKTLAIQRESRDQRRLDLLFADIETGRSRIVLTETSDTWIELNDEISFLRKSRNSSGPRAATASSICICTITTAGSSGA
jgi:dipeptidyl-peptidase 4